MKNGFVPILIRAWHAGVPYLLCSFFGKLNMLIVMPVVSQERAVFYRCVSFLQHAAVCSMESPNFHCYVGISITADLRRSSC